MSRQMRKKIVFLPYDFDTAIGINNEGSLVFSYNLEDIDHTESGADIFNGQQSVLWKSLREMFPDELKSMYQTLRSTGALSYPKVEKAFEDHQAKWPEAVFNEDSWFKYLAPLEEKGSEAYLAMLQGSKAEQRKWWLYNRFRYIDSKYNAGDALTDVITLRGYAKSNITLRPYADIYATIKYGSYLVQTRAARGQSYTLACPLDNVNDTEIYIYSASQLADVGDLSGLKVGYAEFAYATKLQALKLGDADAGYDNGNLQTLYLGNNTLLKTLDVRNCSGLGTGDQKTVDLSGCTGLEEVYFDGTNISGVTLPNGGILRKLHLPGTVTALSILNQTKLTDFTCPDTSHISTLRLENVPQSIDTMGIVNSIAAGSRIRLFNFRWELPDLEGLAVMLDKLDTMRGLDQNGNNMDKPQLYGTIHVPYATGDVMYACSQRYPDVSFTYDHVTATIFFHNRDTLIGQETVVDGAAPVNVPRPTLSDAQYTYTFAGWSSHVDDDVVEEGILNGVEIDKHVYAAYTRVIRTYTVRFFNGTTLLATFNNVPYGTTVVYDQVPDYFDESEAADYVFRGWTNDANTVPITGNTDCYSDWKYIGYYYTKYLAGQLTEYEDTLGLVDTVGAYAFHKYGTLKSISLPAVRTIGEDAFYNCRKLESVESPNLESVGINSFNGCSVLSSIDTGKMETVGRNAFTGCRKLTGLNLDNLTTAANDAFSSTGLLRVSAPKLTVLSSQLFASTSCPDFDLPNTETVSFMAFRYNSALKRLNLPKAGTLGSQSICSIPNLEWIRIGGAANDGMFSNGLIFQACPKLEAIVIDGVTSVPPCTVSTFNSSAVASGDCFIYVPRLLLDAFKAADNWSTYADQIRAIEDYPDLYEEGGEE